MATFETTSVGPGIITNHIYTIMGYHTYMSILSYYSTPFDSKLGL